MGATVEGDAHVRLFLALRLPDDVLDELAAWQLRELHRGRIVPREHLHVTLAFLGHRAASELPAIVAELRSAAAAAEPMRLAVERYRETRSVGMLALRDETGAAGLMAGDLHGRLERLGVYERESRPWLPHVTVLRFRRPEGLRPADANIRTIVPSDAAAYLSRLAPGGARYEVLESVVLGG